MDLSNDSLRLTVIKTIESRCLLRRGSHVVCALSGGADSTALLDVMLSLKDRYGITVSAVHVNHGIRGAEADRDEDFCRSLCHTLGVDLAVKRVDVPAYAAKNRLSEELAARELRYAAFDETLAEAGADTIATAHNANDNAETLMFNIIRGTSPSGIASIPYRRGNIIRPLLAVTRDEIIAYLSARGLGYVTDSTNTDTVHTRNLIRAEIIPRCLDINPAFLSAVSRLTDAAKDDEEYFAAASNISPDDPPSLLKRKIAALCESAGCSGLNGRTVNSIANAVAQKRNADFTLTNGKRLAVRYGRLLFADDGSVSESSDIYRETRLIQGENVFGSGRVTVIFEKTSENFTSVNKGFTTVGYISANICGDVVVRSIRSGDTILCGGMHKSVRRELINKKIRSDARKIIPVFTVSGEPVFVPYVGVSDVFTPSDTEKLRISVSFNPVII